MIIHTGRWGGLACVIDLHPNKMLAVVVALQPELQDRVLSMLPLTTMRALSVASTNWRDITERTFRDICRERSWGLPRR